ncbi:MAG: hypothetical protein CSA81_00525 [Acidobacteria bacterium]|nr:MAG: hypothetical protein CSA81_00525 [Acidobacteriota bacterium]
MCACAFAKSEAALQDFRFQAVPGKHSRTIHEVNQHDETAFFMLILHDKVRQSYSRKRKLVLIPFDNPSSNKKKRSKRPLFLLICPEKMTNLLKMIL